MKIVFGAGHVLGEKVYMGYNEDQMMLDLAQRKAKYAAERYQDIQTTVMNVRAIASYQGIEDFIRAFGADLCSLEHSNADDSIDEGDKEPNRVTCFRTVLNPGDGPCRVISEQTARILGTYVEIVHAANSKGEDAYGAIKRAMAAGCSDAWLLEHGFHTHHPTRAKLSDPAIRQQLAEAEIIAQAGYYGWVPKSNELTQIDQGDKGFAVGLWQVILGALGYDIGNYGPDENGIDQSFGPTTGAATLQFKRDHGLPETTVVDETVLTIAMNALMKLNQAKLVATLQTSLATAQTEITGLNEVILEKQIEIIGLQEKETDLNALKSAWKTVKQISDPP